jgi:hypothetical protein
LSENGGATLGLWRPVETKYLHKRVDKTLLDNVRILVERLSSAVAANVAREPTASVILVAYLEDREIITDAYRASRSVSTLVEFLENGDASGLERLA